MTTQVREPWTTGASWLKACLPSLTAIAGVMLLVKLFGFVEKQLVAFWFGATYRSDAYFTAITAITAIFYFAKELFEPVLLPRLARAAAHDAKETAIPTLQIAGVGLGVFGLLCACTLFLFKSTAAGVLAPGMQAQHQVMLSELLRVVAWSLPLLCLSVATQTLLNARRRFMAAAAGDLALKVSLILGVVGAYATGSVLFLGLAPVFGSAFRLLSHIPSIRSLVSRTMRRWYGTRSELVSIAVLAAPLLLASAFSQSREVFENHFTSHLAEGAISAHLFAKRLVELPIVLVAQALTIVSFSHMAGAVAAGKPDAARAMASTAIRTACVIFVPMASALFLVSGPIVRVVFAHGAFDANATQLTAAALAVYALGLPFLAVEPIVLAFFFALGDTRTPVAVGILAALVELTIMACAGDYFGIRGIAGAVVVAKVLKLVVLGVVLHSRQLRGLYLSARELGRLAAAFCACLGVGWAVVAGLDGGLEKGGFLSQVVVSLAATSAVTATFLAVSHSQIKAWFHPV